MVRSNKGNEHVLVDSQCLSHALVNVIFKLFVSALAICEALTARKSNMWGKRDCHLLIDNKSSGVYIVGVVTNCEGWMPTP